MSLREFAERSGVFSLEGLLTLFGAAVILLGGVLFAAQGTTVEKTDFTVTYIGAAMMYQGRGAQMYDLQQQEQMRRALFTKAEPLIFEHPPFEALLLAPLGALPYRTAYLVWGVLNGMVWLTVLLLLRAHLPAPRDPLAYWALWLLFAPLGVALYQGQSSLWLLLLFALSILALRRGADVQAGLWLGLGLFKFQFVIPFVLILLLRRKWRVAASFSLTAVALGMLSLLAVGWRGVLSYVNLLASAANHPANVSYGSGYDMATLQGATFALLGQVLPHRVLTLVVGVASLLLIGFVGLRWREVDREGDAASAELMFAGALAVSLLCGLHMFAHDMSPLILALLLAAAHLPSARQPAARWLMRTLMAVFWFPPLYFAMVAWHCLYLMAYVLAAFSLLTIWQASPRRAPVALAAAPLLAG